MSRKYRNFLPLPQKGLEFPGAGEFFRTKRLKNCVKLNWNFQRHVREGGRGSHKNSLLWGGINIFWNNRYTLLIDQFTYS